MPTINAQEVNTSKYKGLSNVQHKEFVTQVDGTDVPIKVKTDNKGRAYFMRGGKVNYLTHEEKSMRVTDEALLAMYNYDPTTGTINESPLFDFSYYISTARSLKTARTAETKKEG